MAKDSKGHGSNGKGGGILGKTGRTAEEYAEHLRSQGDPETMARKKAAAEKDKDPTPSKAINKRGDTFTPKYNAGAVDKAINSAYRGKKPPSSKQRSVTHALLKGRD